MLLLSRHVNEKIVLRVPGHGDIEVVVAEVRGNVVRLGFTAPDEVNIYRSEILDRAGGPLRSPQKKQKKGEAG